MVPTEGAVLLSSSLGSIDWMTQAVIDQWRGKGADTMSLADREFMDLAGKLTMVGMTDDGQAQDAIIRLYNSICGIILAELPHDHKDGATSCPNCFRRL